MFRKTRPSSQSYQVAAVCGAPLGLTVATTAGFGAARNASTSGGTGTGGTPPSLLRRHGHRLRRLLDPDIPHGAQPDDDQRADDDPARRAPQRRVPDDGAEGESGEAEADRRRASAGPEDREGDRDRREVGADVRDRAGGEEVAEVAAAKRPGHVRARLSAQRLSPAYDCQNGIACPYSSTSSPESVSSASAYSTNSSSVAPPSTDSAQSSSVRRSWVMCGPASSATPKWIRASRSGARRSISSSVSSHASTSTSGGGVGGMMKRPGRTRTPHASPA